MHKKVPRAWAIKMKKIIVMLFAILGMSIGLLAGTTKSCKITGSQDGATVVASIIEIGDGYVMVELDNDGTFAVNVTVNVTCSLGSVGRGERATKVYPQQAATIKITMSGAKKEHKLSDYSISTLSGSRCN